jgi:hypothetical protein
VWLRFLGEDKIIELTKETSYEKWGVGRGDFTSSNAALNTIAKRPALATL